MTFYDRYALLADKHRLDPCSQKTADMLGLTRATISSWNVKGTTPKGETVAKIADTFGVSADYLLGRTDDQTDYANNRPTIVKKSDNDPIPFTKHQRDTSDISTIQILYNSLDDTDKLKAEGVIQGMLMQDKYLSSRQSAYVDAAHARTDIMATPDEIAHDEKIMDGDDF